MININNMLQDVQAAVDNAVDTVAHTRRTQTILQKNIRIVDEKIGHHNEDPESHEDIRIALEGMPSMILDPTPSPANPNSVEIGEPTLFSFSASTVSPSINLLGFKITLPDGTVEDWPVTGDPSMTGSASGMLTVNVGSIGETFISVQAYGDHGFVSDTVHIPVVATRHSPPDPTQLVCTIPDIICHDQTYQFTVTGITDPDEGDVDSATVPHWIKYRISSANAALIFPVNDAMVQGQSYEMRINSSLVYDPDGVDITITAYDERGLERSAIIHRNINQEPDATNAVHNDLAYLNPGDTTRVFSIGNVTDGDNDKITYSVRTDNPSIVLPQNENLNLNQDYPIQVSSSAVEGAPYTFIFTFYDGRGGSTEFRYTSEFNTKPTATDMTFNGIDGVEFKTTGPNTISFGGAVSAPGQVITYEIGDYDTSALQISPNTGILDNETVTITCTANAVRGRSYPITIYAVDSAGGRTAVTKTIHINNLPTGADLKARSNIPDIVTPSTTYNWKFTKEVDDDGQPLTYSISSTQEGMVITNGTNIGPNDVFTVTTPSEEQWERGTTCNLIVRVTDPVESDEVTIPIKLNRLPSCSSVAITFEDEIFGGSENSQMLKITQEAVDLDAHTLTYEIECDANMTFSKKTGLKVNDTVTYYSKKVTAKTAHTIKIYAVDQLGEKSLDYFEETIYTYPLIISKQPTINSITSALAVTGKISWSAYNVTASVIDGPEGLKSSDRWVKGHTFRTNRTMPEVGKASGNCNNHYGMNQTEANTLYGSGVVTITGVGFQRITIAQEDDYIITAVGARGGSSWLSHPGSCYYDHGGRGALVCGKFHLKAGDILYFGVGQSGSCSAVKTRGGGGGGATFVLKKNTSTGAYTFAGDGNVKVDVLLVAGGGAGRDAQDGTTITAFDIGTDTCALNGKSANGSNPAAASTTVTNGGGGGASLNANGGAVSGVTAVNKLLANAVNSSSAAANYGGFPGGGMSSAKGGGGGAGYSGGNATAGGTSASQGGTSFINTTLGTALTRAVASHLWKNKTVNFGQGWAHIQGSNYGVSGIKPGVNAPASVSEATFQLS